MTDAEQGNSLDMKNFYSKLTYVALFAIAFAFVEAAVVVYLRSIYYPQGFHFPIKRIYDPFMTIEVIREFSTIVMMFAVSAALSRKFWEGFGYFLVIFGVWDIFFYVWLKVCLNWPVSPFEPDILFLIPIPWIAPVLAPVIVSLVMIYIGTDIASLFFMGHNPKPRLLHWVLVIAGSAVILYSFMKDIDAAFFEKYPQPYNWYLFAVGILCYLAAHVHLHRQTVINNK